MVSPLGSFNDDDDDDDVICAAIFSKQARSLSSGEQ